MTTASYSLKLASHKGKQFLGLSFKIDRPKGYVKTWDQPDGSKKVFTYPVDYGYFPGIKGEDGEGLDAFVGDDPNGHLEAFQKLKPDENGRMVLDETKFLVGVNDRQREEIYRLYSNQVWARRVFHDVNELREALEKFKLSKKDRYREKVASYRFNRLAESLSKMDTIDQLFAANDRSASTTGDEAAQSTTFQGAVTG